MKIRESEKTTMVRLGSVMPGEVFRYDNTLMLRTAGKNSASKPSHQVNKGVYDGDYEAHAVEIENGKLVSFASGDTKVELIEGEFVIKSIG